jgi:uncharacterized protein YbjT (DUF2867 family)
MSVPSQRTILVTGASGYVGGRLLQRLQASGRRLRCLTRRAVGREGSAVARVY